MLSMKDLATLRPSLPKARVTNKIAQQAAEGNWNQATIGLLNVPVEYEGNVKVIIGEEEFILYKRCDMNVVWLIHCEDEEYTNQYTSLFKILAANPGVAMGKVELESEWTSMQNTMRS